MYPSVDPMWIPAGGAAYRKPDALHMYVGREVSTYDSYFRREIHVDVVAVIPRRFVPPKRPVSFPSKGRWTASGT